MYVFFPLVGANGGWWRESLLLMSKYFKILDYFAAIMVVL